MNARFSYSMMENRHLIPGGEPLLGWPQSPHDPRERETIDNTGDRLVLQFPLSGSEGVRFRVESEWRGYTPGKAMVFDDSFVHETWNRTAADRVVLLFDVWHPDLGDDEILAVVEMFRRAAAKPK